ncbi:MAG: protein translocase subunit SecD [Myxococcota bacterium]
MEGIYWLRISAVAALFFGAIWILMPTVLRQSAEQRLSAAAQTVEAPSHTSAALELELPILEGDPAGLAQALSDRLRVGGVSARKVDSGGSKVTVELGAGATLEGVAALASPAGEVKLHAPDALQPAAEAPEGSELQPQLVDALKQTFGAGADKWTALLPKLAHVRVEDATVAVPIALSDAEIADDGATGKLSWADEQVLPDTLPIVAVAVDGEVAGVAFADGRYFGLGQPDQSAALLASAPMPGRLGEPVKVGGDAPADATPEPVADAAESSVPPWLEGLLPNTAISLGLDLQGGIDLTLQVELDEAVLGQVARDVTYLRDEAAKEGVDITSVKRAHSQPVLNVASPEALADVQAFMHKHAAEYEYTESDGDVHSFVLSDARQEQVRDQAVEQVLETLRKRVNATGVKEPSIVKKSGGRINVQLPGMDDVQAAVDAIGTTAVLEFRMVDEEFDDAYLEQMLADARQQMPEDQYLDDDLLNEWLYDNKRLDDDRIILWEYAPDPEQNNKEVRTRALPLKSEVVLTGNDVNDAGVGWDQNQQPYVMLEFKPRGGQIFCDITEESVGKRFAVILDDVVQSAPNIKERICGGSARIEMGQAEDPTKEAQTLALVLRTGALDAPVVVASVRHVGASLGADAIKQGTIAALLGSALVYLFLVIWYKTAGIVADIALTINVLLVLASLGMFGATLTLPGIAGIALTVGMAVDSNIIIYERIREELRLGVHPRKAVDIGFEKALVAVVDANITTGIAGIVLYSYGSGPIKGFAVTLLVGIITTLVTAVFVTRTIMESITRSSATRLRI